MKPHIRILPDIDGMHFCGLFEGGYSSVGVVGKRSLAEAIRFYFKILRADGI